nr:chemotaxis-specific protein-glutamate methyltransferase CheB [uncultured Desulfuromonas sp.]
MIRTLIVEDSPVEQELLAHILTADGTIEVVGIVANGEDALKAAASLRPDVITMDIHMPRMDGYETTRQIMETHPVPIVIVSGSYVANDMDRAFRAMEAGALAIVEKPWGPGHPDYNEASKTLIRTVKAMSEVKLVRRWHKIPPLASMPPYPALSESAVQEIKLVAIGASTGGPAAFHEILAALPEDFDLPIVAVQHMACGFLKGFVRWLAKSTGRPIDIARDGETLTAGHVYFAPDDRHLLVDRELTVHLCDSPAENGVRPSVSVLFRSVAQTLGAHAAAVLLTGMGCDGAKELKQLQQQGAVTLIQDRETAVVYGMPGEALNLNAADHVLPPQKIAAFLHGLASHHAKRYCGHTTGRPS